MSAAYNITLHRRVGRATPGLIFVVGLFLQGCAAGPDFRRPAAPNVDRYQASPAQTTASQPNTPGGESQRFVTGADIPGDWWTLFHSNSLNALVERSLSANHDLKAAQAALAAARENTLAQRGVFYPNVSLGVSASRQRQSGALAPTPSNNAFTYSLFTPQVSVSYSPDVFGLNRRGAEAIKAQEQSTRYQMIAAYLTLTTNVVNTAIQAGSVREQIAATHRAIDADTKIVDILKYQLAKGYASRVDLAAQQSQLAQTVANLPPLLKQAAQLQDLLATLTGQFPSQAPQVDFDLSSLTLPTDLPVGLPSALIEQRPDVLQAEANLHAASAEIGVAAANRLPNVQLTGAAGSTGLALGQVFGPGSAFWQIGAAATAPIFDGGTLKHQERAARATYTEAAEQYRSTVLNGVQNVADTLSALEQDAEGLKAAAAASDAAKVTLDLSQRQYKDGYASGLVLLTAEQAYQQTQITLVQAEANRYADTAALFQALGGGWWRRTDLAQGRK